VASAAAAKLQQDVRIAVRAGARLEAEARRAPEQRPQLVVVPRSRRTVRAAAVVFSAVFSLMLLVTAFQTRLAESQLELDRTERAVQLERNRFAELRKENAALRSPEAVALSASAFGMAPARTEKFLTVAPEIDALVAAAAGDRLDPEGIGGDIDPFEVHKQVKRVVSGETP
jgi:hypothetical protein